MTVAWYWDASGGFIPETPDTWNSRVAFLVFPRITSSPGIERRAVVRFDIPTQYISALSVADQVRELQTALSLNKSELARILRVSRPTVYDWLDDGQPNAENLSRIGTLLRSPRHPTGGSFTTGMSSKSWSWIRISARSTTGANTVPAQWSTKVQWAWGGWTRPVSWS